MSGSVKTIKREVRNKLSTFTNVFYELIGLHIYYESLAYKYCGDYRDHFTDTFSELDIEVKTLYDQFYTEFQKWTKVGIKGRKREYVRFIDSHINAIIETLQLILQQERDFLSENCNISLISSNWDIDVPAQVAEWFLTDPSTDKQIFKLLHWDSIPLELEVGNKVVDYEVLFKHENYYGLGKRATDESWINKIITQFDFSIQTILKYTIRLAKLLFNLYSNIQSFILNHPRIASLIILIGALYASGNIPENLSGMVSEFFDKILPTLTGVIPTDFSQSILILLKLLCLFEGGFESVLQGKLKEYQILGKIDSFQFWTTHLLLKTIHSSFGRLLCNTEVNSTVIIETPSKEINIDLSGKTELTPLNSQETTLLINSLFERMGMVSK